MKEIVSKLVTYREKPVGVRLQEGLSEYIPEQLS